MLGSLVKRQTVLVQLGAAFELDNGFRVGPVGTREAIGRGAPQPGVDEGLQVQTGAAQMRRRLVRVEDAAHGRLMTSG